MHRILCLPVALALVLGGCATDQRSQSLTKTLNAYAGAVRWGDFASAEHFVDPEVREAHPLTPFEQSRFKQYRVSEYDDPVAPTVVDENEVTQSVHIGLINVNTQAERAITDHQTWRYDPQKHQWWLVSGLPDLGNAR